MEWVTNHPEILLNALVLLAAIVGAMLPADHPLGVFLRRWGSDLAGKNVPPKPPAPPTGGPNA